eukprot:TRINITY_DN8591_c0_g1_i1.p1 TRINITY_DN8591_c0_g1~~TRINITY_DN8591_c0_g1_i1.p1  ORF type:complete len:234 (-),score=15.15 TRINITY_DN8591_c0_g1_i1:81-782(-)
MGIPNLLLLSLICGTLSSAASAQHVFNWRKAFNITPVFNVAKYDKQASRGFNGLPYREVLARFTPNALVGAEGDSQAHGYVDINIDKWQGDYNIRFTVTALDMHQNEEPSSVTIHQGNPKENGPVVLTLYSATSVGGSDSLCAPENSKWRAVFPPFQKLRRGQRLQMGYSFMLQGGVKKAGTVDVASGKKLREVLDSMIDKPAAYYAVLGTPTYPDGATRGQMQGSFITKLLH